VLLNLDSHVHYYPIFSPYKMCESAYVNLHAGGEKMIAGIVIIESSPSLPGFDNFLSDCELLKNFKVFKSSDYGRVQWNDCGLEREIYVFKGAQRVTDEGLEVLGLFLNELSYDLQSLASCVEQINIKRAVSVIPWSFGKWLGPRRTSLSKFLSSHIGQQYCFLGDIVQRPGMINDLQGIQAGLSDNQRYALLAGSDPLPLRGEDALVGKLSSLITVEDDLFLSDPVLAIKKSLLSLPPKTMGSHNTVWQACYRWLSYNIARKL
jgi:hypothetical protein